MMLCVVWGVALFQGGGKTIFDDVLKIRRTTNVFCRLVQSPVQLTPWRIGRFNPCQLGGEKNSQIFPSYYSCVVSCSRVGIGVYTV